MNKQLEKEYIKFQKKFAGYYKSSIPSQDIEYIRADDCFAGFLCYKAMNEPGNYILKISAPSSTNKLLPAFLYSFFQDAGLDINMNEVPPSLYVKVDSKDLLERLSDEEWRKKQLMTNFIISDFYLNQKDISNPNRNLKTDKHNKIKGLVEIIGDPCQVNLIPHNFPELNISKRKEEFEKIYGKNVEVIDYSYTIMLMNNPASEIIKMYDFLEKISPQYKTKPFLSTRNICWVRMDELHFKMNPQFKYEKYPEFTAHYYPDENFIKIDRICETEVKKEDGEVKLTTNSGEIISMPFLSGKIKTYPPNKSLVKKIKRLKIKVKINK